VLLLTGKKYFTHCTSASANKSLELSCNNYSQLSSVIIHRSSR